MNSKIEFNEAISLWEKGLSGDSITKLEKLILKYPTLEITQEAYRKRKIYLDVYKKEYNPHKNEKGLFTYALQDKLNKYFKTNNVYPDDLYSLNFNDEILTFLNSCIYEKAISNFGFKINCKSANEMYWESEENPLENEESELKKYLPINSFMAYYYLRHNPNHPIYSTKVKNINLNETNKANPKIKLKKYSASYNGYIETLEPKIKTIKINPDGATIDISIDGKKIYRGKEKREIKYNFTKKLSFVRFSFEHSLKNINYTIKISE